MVEPTHPERVRFVVDRFNSMLADDGARLDILSVEHDVVELRYVGGPEGGCAACVLDPDDLEALVAEALVRTEPTLTVRVLRP